MECFFISLQVSQTLHSNLELQICDVEGQVHDRSVAKLTFKWHIYTRYKNYKLVTLLVQNGNFSHPMISSRWQPFKILCTDILVNDANKSFFTMVEFPVAKLYHIITTVLYVMYVPLTSKSF